MFIEILDYIVKFFDKDRKVLWNWICGKLDLNFKIWFMIVFVMFGVFIFKFRFWIRGLYDVRELVIREVI